MSNELLDGMIGFGLGAIAVVIVQFLWLKYGTR